MQSDAMDMLFLDRRSLPRSVRYSWLYDNIGAELFSTDTSSDTNSIGHEFKFLHASCAQDSCSGAARADNALPKREVL